MTKRRRNPFSQAEYEAAELRRHAADMKRWRTFPLAERREAEAEWKDIAATAPEIIAQAVSFLLDGSFGAGALLAALQAAKDRGNVMARLVQIASVLNFPGLDPGRVGSLYRSLTPAQRKALDAAVGATMARSVE